MSARTVRRVRRTASQAVMQACEPRTLLAATLIKDIATGSAPVGVGGVQVTVPNGRLFFIAANAVTGSIAKLFSTDGTSAGTAELRAIFDGGSLGVVGNKVLFNTLESDNIYRLWITDGTVAGTSFFRLGSANGFVSLGSKVIFNMDNGIWVSDGTTGGTKQIQANMTISPLAGNAVLNGVGYFHAYVNGSGNPELYKSDGNSVTLVKEIRAGAQGSAPDSFVATTSAVFFVAADANGDRELYRTDGTSNGTVLVKNVNANPAETSGILKMVPVGSKVFFSANDETSTGYELWVSDGTTGGTKKVHAGLQYNSFTGANAGGKFIFSGYTSLDTNKVNAVFVTDGNSFSALSAPNTGAFTAYLGSLNGVAYFDGLLTNGGTELYTSNGSTSGLYANIQPGTGSGQPVTFVPSSTGMYFLADDGTHGREWFFITGPRADAVSVGQGSTRPYRVVQLTFNDDLGASITKDDVVLRRRKDKRVMAGSYWKFSTFLDNQNRTVVQARVTKADLQGKYEIVILKNSVASPLGMANASDIRVSFFLEPIVTGATFGGTPIDGSLVSDDDDVLD